MRDVCFLLTHAANVARADRRRASCPARAWASLVSYLWVPYDPLPRRAGGRWLPISRDHWFGTDGAGKDLFSQVLVGARVSLFVALASAVDRRRRRAVLGLISVLTPRARRRVGRPPDRRAPSLSLRSCSRSSSSGCSAAHCSRCRSPSASPPASCSPASCTPRSPGADAGLRRWLPTPPEPRRGERSASTSCRTSLRSSSCSCRSSPPWRSSPRRPCRSSACCRVAPVVGTHPRRVADHRHRPPRGDHLSPGAMLVLATLGFNLLGDGLRDATDPRTAFESAAKAPRSR